MNNYRKLSKAQLIELVNKIESVMIPAIPAATESSNKYSQDMVSRLAFETGHLSGSIKTVLSLIEDYKNI